MSFWHLALVAGCVTALSGVAQAQSSSTPAKPAAAPAGKKVVDKQVNPSGTVTKTTADGQRITTHQPIPDTKENRAQHGGPNSETGRNTKPSGR